MLFWKYCTCKDEMQKKVLHNQLKKLRNNVTYLIQKSKNESFKNIFPKKSKQPILDLEKNLI